jgi:hypothetical protein
MKWLREPLVHFLLLGAALFGAFAFWGGPAIPPAGQYHIVVTPTMVQNLALTFQNAEGRAPTGQELDQQIADYVREEILGREARALNLDQDDPAVRRELRGKMEYLLQDSAAIPTPTDAQLNDYLQKNAAALRKPDGTLPALADVRDKLVVAWKYDQRLQTANAAYEKLLAHYVVDVQKPATAPAAANSTVK